jgi:hypothetical protein
MAEHILGLIPLPWSVVILWSSGIECKTQGFLTSTNTQWMPQYTHGYVKGCPLSTYTYFKIRLVISEIFWIGPEKNPKSSFANQTPFIRQ